MLMTARYGTRDLARALPFYDAIAAIVGARRVVDREEVAGYQGGSGAMFLIGRPYAGEANVGNGTQLSDIQKQLGMSEGFDVGLEMSGNPAAFRSMIDNMCHGGKIAMLGIPSEDIAIDWNKVVFNMLTIRGVYGREMYETWYKMTVMIQSGLDISPVITHRLPFSEFQQGFDVMRSGQSGKVVLDWQT